MQNKSLVDLDWKELNEELTFLEKCLWKEFIDKQRNLLKESEKIKPLRSYLTKKEYEEFINLI